MKPTAPAPVGAAALPDEDDFTHYFNATRRLSEALARAESRASAAAEALRGLYTATGAYFEEWGAEHEEDDCPEDDTCSCPLVTGVNAAFARARAFLDGEAGRKEGNEE